MTPPRTVAVVGGGISGLAAAHRLRELDPSLSVTVLEASDRLGGVLQTTQRDGFLIETSGDMFTTKDPWARDLCHRIGFDDELIPTNDRDRRAFIVRRGRLIPVPGGFSLMSPTRMWPMVTTRLIGPLGKLRLACEPWIPRQADDQDESLESFAVRRFGTSAYRWIIQPLISGIYTADPKQLSMRATMKQFVDMERQQGSVTWAMLRARRRQAETQSASGARYSMFVAPQRGMSDLVRALADRLPDNSCQLQCPVQGLTRRADTGQWQLTLDRGPATFDAVVLALPAKQAAQLTAEVHQPLSRQLDQIPHAGVAIAVLAYHRSQIRHPANGFGFVVPLAEHRRVIAGSFASVKFDWRAPADHLLLRVFVGGACQSDLAQLPDDETFQLVDEELRALIGVQGEPVLKQLVRWPAAMPQYHVGHLDRVEQIEQHVATLPHFELAGNAYRGVGIPFCIRSGEQAAARILGRG